MPNLYPTKEIIYKIWYPSTSNYKHWECVHVDLFGPWTFQCVNGLAHFFLALSIIDSSLRWIELHQYKDKSSVTTISLMFDREWFCRYPHPRYVVYDNRPEFTSGFEELILSYGSNDVQQPSRIPSLMPL